MSEDTVQEKIFSVIRDFKERQLHIIEIKIDENTLQKLFESSYYNPGRFIPTHTESNFAGIFMGYNLTLDRKLDCAFEIVT